MLRRPSGAYPSPSACIGHRQRSDIRTWTFRELLLLLPPTTRKNRASSVCSHRIPSRPAEDPADSVCCQEQALRCTRSKVALPSSSSPLLFADRANIPLIQLACLPRGANSSFSAWALSHPPQPTTDLLLHSQPTLTESALYCRPDVPIRTRHEWHAGGSERPLCDWCSTTRAFAATATSSRLHAHCKV